MEEGYSRSLGGRYSSRTPTDSSVASRHPSSPHNENQPPPTPTPRSRRPLGGSRLWQVPPQSSLQEYASWIGDKPVSSQSSSEKRFLQKLHGRILIRQEKQKSSSMETMKHYIARLEAKKDDLSNVELQLIQAYHRRKANKRARRRDSNPFRETAVVPPTICWKREPTLSNKNNKNSKYPTPAAPVPPAEAALSTVMSTIANLQERMNRMGLSSDKLLDMPMHEDSSTSNPSFLHY